MNESRPSIQEPLRVIVVLDDHLMSNIVGLTLNHGAYVTRGASDLAAAVRLLTEWQPHLAVIDMDLGGSRVLQEIGKRPEGGTRIPVIGLTRRGDLKTKLDAFEEGVDDIMTVPLSPEELLARVVAIARRTFGERVQLRPVLKVGDLELDILNRQVRVGSEGLHLTGIEQSLLYLLASNAGQVITRDQIMDTLWGADYVAGSNVVEQHVRSLRTKLQNGRRKPQFIVTVPGRGYRFVPHALGADQSC